MAIMLLSDAVVNQNYTKLLYTLHKINRPKSVEAHVKYPKRPIDLDQINAAIYGIPAFHLISQSNGNIGIHNYTAKLVFWLFWNNAPYIMVFNNFQDLFEILVGGKAHLFVSQNEFW